MGFGTKGDWRGKRKKEPRASENKDKGLHRSIEVGRPAGVRHGRGSAAQGLSRIAQSLRDTRAPTGCPRFARKRVGVPGTFWTARK